jgi:hypothetical protein
MLTKTRTIIATLIAAGSIAAVSVVPSAATAAPRKAGPVVDLVIGPITVSTLVCRESSIMGVMECVWVPQ